MFRDPLVVMKLRRIISTQVSREAEGFSVSAAIDAIAVVNVNEPPDAGRRAGEQEVNEHIKEATDE